ncbi:hypothetical protein FRB99_003034 [Tulasnella sp. 403]|nr:hypothetical protein FRB99_003034 [Tulasnella sp. 403]
MGSDLRRRIIEALKVRAGRDSVQDVGFVIHHKVWWLEDGRPVVGYLALTRGVGERAALHMVIPQTDGSCRSDKTWRLEDYVTSEVKSPLMFRVQFSSSYGTDSNNEWHSESESRQTRFLEVLKRECAPGSLSDVPLVVEKPLHAASSGDDQSAVHDSDRSSEAPPGLTATTSPHGGILPLVLDENQPIMMLCAVCRHNADWVTADELESSIRWVCMYCRPHRSKSANLRVSPETTRAIGRSHKSEPSANVESSLPLRRRATFTGPNTGQEPKRSERSKGSQASRYDKELPPLPSTPESPSLGPGPLPSTSTEAASPHGADLGIALDDSEPWSTSGGSCDLYRGTTRAGLSVALKRPRITGGEYTEDDKRRLRREAATWQELHHPYILEFLGLYELGGQLYLVSPFISNGTIVSYIKKHHGVSKLQLNYQLIETAEAIAYLHAQNVVHGDIKGKNILVSDDGHVLVCDFGLTRPTDARTSLAAKGMGSVRWQAPELWDARASKTVRSDVYAYGILIAEVLSEEVPYPDCLDSGAVILSVKIDRVRPPRKPALSPSGVSYGPIWDVAERCWDENPEARPSMQDVCVLVKAAARSIESSTPKPPHAT